MRSAKAPPIDPRVRALLSPSGKLTTAAAGIPYDQSAAQRVDEAYRTWDAASATAPFREVPLASLHALQRTLRPETVTHFLRRPDAPADTAVMVLRFGERDYVTNGHHRVAAAKIRSDRTIRARYLDTDAMRPKRGASAFARGDLRAMARERVAAENAWREYAERTGRHPPPALDDRKTHHLTLAKGLDPAQRAEYDRHYREARATRENPTRKPAERFALTMQPNDRHPYRLPVRLVMERQHGGRWREVPGSAVRLYYNAGTGAVNGLDATPYASLRPRERAALRASARRAFRELYPRGVPRA